MEELRSAVERRNTTESRRAAASVDQLTALDNDDTRRLVQELSAALEAVGATQRSHSDTLDTAARRQQSLATTVSH